MLIHKHLILSCKVKTPPKDEAAAQNFMKELITLVGMELAELSNGQANPIAWYSTDPNNQGMTATAILTTSHAAMHVWDADAENPAELQFDLYSCKDYDSADVIQHIHKNYSMVSFNGYKINRETMEIEEQLLSE